MFFSYLTAVARQLRPFKTPMLVVAVSALVALLFTFATRPSDQPPRAAGEAQVRLLEDEHALIADLVHSIEVSVEAERVAAERSRAEMRALALAEASKRNAPAAMAQIAGRAAAVRVALPAPKPAAAIEPPLQLQAAAASQPQARKPAVARASGALATVQQIPTWLRAGIENVADWAISAPSRAISQLPERRFL